MKESNLITPVIEKLFYPVRSNEVPDPLQEKPQYVTTLADILENTKTRRYFLTYLQGNKNINCANFWIDVHNLQCCYNQLVLEMSNTSMPDDSNQNSVLDERLAPNFKSAPSSTVCDTFSYNNCDVQSNTISRLSHNNCDTNDNIESSNLHQHSNNSARHFSDQIESTMKQHLQKEVWRIYECYVAVDADHLCPLSTPVRENVVTKIKQMHKHLEPNMFSECQAEVFNLLQNEVPGFLSSDFHLRHQYDLLSYSCFTLQDILHSHAAFPSFMEFMEQENQEELLKFWMGASNFRNQLRETISKQDKLNAKTTNSRDSNMNPNETAQNDAMVLYDKYFSLQASHSLGFSDTFRFHIESNICALEGPESTCFDNALRVVLYVLQTVFVRKYLKSSLYESIVNDIVNSAKSVSTHRRTLSNSTCSSDVSSSVTQSQKGLSNTLLAGNTSSNSVTDITIDSSLIHCPERMWKRKHCRLSCGSINHVGRFESDLVVEGFKDSKKITNKLKRLLNKDDDKARLDFAYSAAESLLCEITCVTLDSRNSPTNPYAPDNPYDLYLENCMTLGIDPHSQPVGAFSDGEGGYTFGGMSRGSSSTNVSTLSHHSTTPFHSPTKQPVPKPFSGMTKSSSFSSNLLNSLTGSQNEAHLYSIANFDIKTEIEKTEWQHSKAALQINLRTKM